MGGLTIGSALFGDLVFLPALLACFGRRENSDRFRRDGQPHPSRTDAAVLSAEEPAVVSEAVNRSRPADRLDRANRLEESLPDG
jgi:hypothetical protein